MQQRSHARSVARLRLSVALNNNDCYVFGMAVRELARRRPVATFWTIAVLLAGLALPLGIALFSAYPDAMGEIVRRTGGRLNTNILYTLPVAAGVPGGLALVLYSMWQPATPLVAAFLTAGLVGQGRLRELTRLYRFWAPEVGWRRGLTIWAMALGTLIAIKVATGLVFWGTRDPGLWPDFHWDVDFASPTFWFLLVTSLFFDGGGLFEETGWRGFGQPELQQRVTPLRAAIGIGILWSLWHVPVKLGLLQSGAGRLVFFYTAFTVFTVCTSIVFGYFFNRLGGSILIGIALHGLTNDSSGLAGIPGANLPQAADDLSNLVILLPVMVAALAIIGLDGERLGTNRSVATPASGPGTVPPAGPDAEQTEDD